MRHRDFSLKIDLIKSSLRRWLLLIVSLAAVWLFVFVIAPAAKQIPQIRAVAAFIDESGIEASALYYTGVEETATSDMYLHNARVYRPNGP